MVRTSGYKTMDVSLQHTLALIKPEGLVNERKIIARIKKEGFLILAKRRVHLTPEQTSDFYLDLYGRRDFPLLVASTSAAPVTVLHLGRPRAVDKLKEIVGPCDVADAKADSPDSLNAQFGNAECNFAAVHASCDVFNAQREIHFFWPQSTVEPPQGISEGLQFLDKEVTPLLQEGLSQMLKEKPVEPMLWLANWLLKNNPRQPLTLEHLRYHHFYPKKQGP